jgi:hypothetical protein
MSLNRLRGLIADKFLKDQQLASARKTDSLGDALNQEISFVDNIKGDFMAPLMIQNA